MSCAKKHNRKHKKGQCSKKDTCKNPTNSSRGVNSHFKKLRNYLESRKIAVQHWKIFLTIKLYVLQWLYWFFSDITRAKRKQSGYVTKALEAMRQWQSIKQRDVTDTLPPNWTADSSAGSKWSSMLEALRRQKAEASHKKPRESKACKSTRVFHSTGWCRLIKYTLLWRNYNKHTYVTLHLAALQSYWRALQALFALR